MLCHVNWKCTYFLEENTYSIFKVEEWTRQDTEWAACGGSYCACCMFDGLSLSPWWSAVYSSKTTVSFYQTTWHDSPEDKYSSNLLSDWHVYGAFKMLPVTGLYSIRNGRFLYYYFASFITIYVMILFVINQFYPRIWYRPLLYFL
jgi:hypothetical protein